MADEHGQLMGAVGKVEGLVIGITQRQDIANGRTAKLEAKVESLERSRDKTDGAKMNWRELFGYFTGIGGIIIAVVALWFK